MDPKAPVLLADVTNDGGRFRLVSASADVTVIEKLVGMDAMGGEMWMRVKSTDAEDIKYFLPAMVRLIVDLKARAPLQVADVLTAVDAVSLSIPVSEPAELATDYGARVAESARAQLRAAIEELGA